MFGRRRWRFNASSVSASILRGSLNYATFIGIIWFSVKNIGCEGRLVVQNRRWYKWFCLISRTLMCGLNIILLNEFIHTIKISQLKILVFIRFVICVVCAISTLVIQLFHGHRVVDVVTRFLRLFQRISALSGCQDMGYGGKWVLVLLLMKMIGVAYELCYQIPLVLSELTGRAAVCVICDIYNTANASIILHLSFVAYLSIGIAYDQLNSYVRHELRQQLFELNSIHGIPVSRSKLIAVGCRLDECLAIYDEIQKVGKAFHGLFEFLQCVTLFFGFLSLASIAFFIMINLYGGVRLWVLAAKIFLDILLLTVAVHIANSNSRVVRRLSLDNYYMSENKDWNMKLEMFLCRLNYNEFRVRPLGLFEVSNKLLLVFMSGLVTYLTYIIQYDMQSNQI